MFLKNSGPACCSFLRRKCFGCFNLCICCPLWYRPSVLCMWELPIWSTSSMKTKPRTRDTPMQAWSCSWLCSWFPLALRAASTSPFASEASTTPTWPWLWCPPAETRVRGEQKEADGLLKKNHTSDYWSCSITEPCSILVRHSWRANTHKTNISVWRSLLHKRNRRQHGCTLPHADLCFVWGFKLLQSIKANTLYMHISHVYML